MLILGSTFRSQYVRVRHTYIHTYIRNMRVSPRSALIGLVALLARVCRRNQSISSSSFRRDRESNPNEHRATKTVLPCCRCLMPWKTGKNQEANRVKINQSRALIHFSLRSFVGAPPPPPPVLCFVSRKKKTKTAGGAPQHRRHAWVLQHHHSDGVPRQLLGNHVPRGAAASDRPDRVHGTGRRPRAAGRPGCRTRYVCTLN